MRICVDENLFIGTVTKAQGRRYRSTISTDITFRVERSLRGDHGSHQVLTIPGGKVGKAESLVSGADMLPRGEVGKRYLVGWYPSAPLQPNSSSHMFGAVLVVDSEVELPPTEAILDAWYASDYYEVFCIQDRDGF